MKKSRNAVKLAIIFAAFLFCSCGIPTYFWTETGNYGVTELDRSPAKDQFELHFNSQPGKDGDLAKVTKGPGLLLFYFLDDNTSIPEQTRGLGSEFQKQFQGKDKLGISPGYIKRGEPLLSIQEKNEESSYSFWPFALNSAGNVQQSPGFAISLDQRTPEGNIKYFFKLSNENGVLKLDASTDETFADPTTIDLYRYNGKPFEKSTGSDDFAGVSEDDKYYIHIFATMVFRGEQFNNIFWTDPLYCGCWSVT